MGVPYIEATVEGGENFSKSQEQWKGVQQPTHGASDPLEVLFLEDLFRQFDKMGPIYKCIATLALTHDDFWTPFREDVLTQTKGDILVRSDDEGNSTFANALLADPDKLWPRGMVAYKFWRTFPPSNFSFVCFRKHFF